MNKRELMKQQRREQIIEVAKEMILKNDVQQVQLQDVAKEVGIGIATFYRYFANKELLILAVHNEIISQMNLELERIVSESSSAYEQIERILTYYIDLIDDPQHQFIKFFKAIEAYKQMPQDSNEYHDYIKVRRKMAHVLYLIAKKGEKDQSIREGIDIPEYVFTVVQNISYFTVESFLTEHDPELPVKLDPKKQLQLIKEMFLNFIKS
ncbi:TetR/AcrR family transcriptional regulator [Solibacillus merdavium]|uniref:TetR/AcrR family transcriptional regulator n=2 Tax=Solibacillus TaxID=648800 RepID=A0ABR8XM35_9BACL|nr:TetR/AcrR family transcriptional regulator [Solibacillus merdavium]MBD8032995.1 TetR/AcrR family transcriptional regulator [Solibacillus merdavium]